MDLSKKELKNLIKAIAKGVDLGSHVKQNFRIDLATREELIALLDIKVHIIQQQMKREDALKDEIAEVLHRARPLGSVPLSSMVHHLIEAYEKQRDLATSLMKKSMKKGKGKK